MSKTYAQIKSQFSAHKESLIYVQNRINIINRFLSEKDYDTVAFIGSGPGYLVSKSLERIYRNLSGRAALSVAAGDLWLHARRYKKPLENAVIIAISPSGGESELIEAIKAVKEITQARFIALTCAENSPVKEIADIVLEMPWALDESVYQTRSVSNLYAAGAVIAAGISGCDEAIAEFSSTVDSLEDSILSIEPSFLQLCKERFENVVILADAEAAGLGEEGAFEFNEISRTVSNCYDLYDLRQGSLSMINKATLVIVSLENGEEQGRKLIADIVRKKAIIITCTDEPMQLDKVYLNISFGKLDIIGRGLALLIVCQFAAYYKALVKGISPVNPPRIDAWMKL